MKKRLAVFLVFSIWMPSGILHAQDTQGVDLLIRTVDGREVRGELIVVKEASLLLKDSVSGADVSVDVRAADVITVVKKSKFWQGAGLGFLASSLSLSAIAWATDEEYFKDPEGGGPLMLMLFFGIPGFLAGGVIGGILGTDKQIEIQGKSELEIREALEYLRSRARVREFQ